MALTFCTDEKEREREAICFAIAIDVTIYTIANLPQRKRKRFERKETFELIEKFSCYSKRKFVAFFRVVVVGLTQVNFSFILID